MIDLHIHLLPGVDDGPPDLPAAVSLARAATHAGIREAAVTPHIDYRYGLDVGRVEPELGRLSAALAAGDVDLRLHRGGEVSIARFWDMSRDELASVSLGGGGYLLVECPHTEAPDGVLASTVLEAHARGFRVLLGHPERSPPLRGRVDRVRDLVEHGCLVQVTAGSVLGAFGRRVEDFTIALFRERLVHVVSSDAHDERGRSPRIGEAFDRLSEKLPEAGRLRGWWTEEAPAAVIAGAQVGAPPAVAGISRRWWRRALA